MSLVVNLPTFAGRNGMAVSRSLDGGLSWSAPIFVIDEETPGVLNDKNSLTADSTDSDFVYAVWDRLRLFDTGGFEGPVYLARTTDGGVSWEEAREIFNPGLNNQTIGNQILVLPDGTVIDFFNEIVNVLPDGTPQPGQPTLQLRLHPVLRQGRDLGCGFDPGRADPLAAGQHAGHRGHGP